MLKNKFLGIVARVLFVLFFAGVIFSFIASGLYENNIDDYSHTHGEYQTYAPVSNVAYDDESQLVYVFYSEANTVNVYSIDGTFQWSVSIPKQSNNVPQFYLDGNRMYLIWYDTYIYNAKTGEFIEAHECTDAEAANADIFEKNYSLDGTGLEFDLIDVYTVDKNGDAERYIVNRPDYYALINPFVGWAVSFTSVLILAAMAILSALKSAIRHKRNP